MTYKRVYYNQRIKSKKPITPLQEDIGYYIMCRTQIAPGSFIGDLAFHWIS